MKFCLRLRTWRRVLARSCELTGAESITQAEEIWKSGKGRTAVRHGGGPEAGAAFKRPIEHPGNGPIARARRLLPECSDRGL